MIHALPDNTDAFLDMLSPSALQSLYRKVQARVASGNKRVHGFKLGYRVTFSHQGVTKFGCVVRINPKTISVAEEGDDKGIWKVSPGLLSHLRSAV